MYTLRRWATRNARPLEIFYRFTARGFHTLDPFWSFCGLGRLERVFATIEAACKGALFDCNMCGRCVLSSTGMTCPTNCPKNLRNGPCGGVRDNGHCEVQPEMACVWCEAWAGAKRMKDGMAIRKPLPPRGHDIEGTSAWLRLTSDNMARRAAALEARGE